MGKSSLVKKIHVPEMLVLVVFILYLIFPVSTPSALNPYIESPLGVIVLLAIILALFIYSHPIVAILFVFVAYTLLRRSSVVTPSTSYVQYTKPHEVLMVEAEQEIKEATPPQNKPQKADLAKKQPRTLEEEIVNTKAPVGKSEKITFMESSYLPVSTNLAGTSSV